LGPEPVLEQALGLVPEPELGPELELGPETALEREPVPVLELALGLHNQQQPIHSSMPPPSPKLMSVSS
jgi:hypothetical protein